MCYKCAKRANVKEIIDLQGKIRYLSQKLDTDLSLTKNEEFVKLIFNVEELLSKHNKIVEFRGKNLK